ncbi:putative E3 ubiquitin-protein ligase LIN-2 isoform X2 [Hibiscus syriacus]|uniref:putative E3 ubiquitin-protein ligase LIN-2 isoform X2 n=1 Tax=Hibiscus syriacus TaxID=106335 RepID=UPI001924DF09|nr:putative E3 ubiquitin-protein ligase LIN-2 isoform X2 [Hibiscus syriacus]
MKLELAISILAEICIWNEVNRQIILNSDPQLEIFLRLLRNSSLFLKAAVLLYLLKPKAKQMISTEWVPLVLRVLEFGEQLQTLFTVRCSPQVAAFYFLDQLLTDFNEDRSLENASQVVSLGGLSLLIRNVEIGDVPERHKAAMIISCCIRADGSCRNYLADKLNKASLIELIVGNRKDSNGSVIALLTELLCLNRRKQITKFLNDLLNGWGGLNTMHILLAYLQKSRPEERPLVAVILLQLDILSFYREIL